MNYFSIARLWAIIIKEFNQIRRDRTTLGMIIGVPLMQLILFGYAINADPKNLPTVVIDADKSQFSRTILQAMDNSQYFRFVKEADNEQQARDFLDRGEALFVVNIPSNFSRDLVRGDRPNILLELDGTDSVAVGAALGVFEPIVQSALERLWVGPLQHLQSQPPPFQVNVHTLYNPDKNTQYSIVPGLLGVVLNLTLVFVTAQAITREYERGTMEHLMSTPVRPLEVMLGKMMPYVIIGYIQVSLILAAAHFIFKVPISGSLSLLYLMCLPFIAANLLAGLTFSTLASNQLQATQISVFYFLPSMLLSGFMFPFYGMPQWAQWIGSCLPLTHFLRIVRGILLKGDGFIDILPSLWPILLFLLVMLWIALKRYRQTLD